MSVRGHVANEGIGLNNWLVNAFNGEWLRTEDAVPLRSVDVSPRIR